MSADANPLSGHVGHLDATQQAALDAFKTKLQADGLWIPAPDGDDPRAASHDDGTLLRFLRARRFIVDDATGQFRDTEAWRKRNDMERLYERVGIDDYEETRRLYPQWTGRRDKRGIPVYVFRVADLDANTMAAYMRNSNATVIGAEDEDVLTDSPPTSTPTSTASSPPGTPGGKEKKHTKNASSTGSTSSGFLRGSWFGGGGAKADSSPVAQAAAANSANEPTPARMMRLFALYENLTRFVMPLCSVAPGRANPEVPITQSNNIVDISGVGLRQFWNLRSHMQDASQLATAHYPETLDRIFIIGAPSFFPTVWSWIKKWFDPITVSKIFILPGGTAEVYETLSKFIDHENIPTQYGGALEFQFGDMPSLDPELSSIVQWTEDAAVRQPKAPDSKEKDAKAPVTERTLPKGPVYWVREPSTEAVVTIAGGGLEATMPPPRDKECTTCHRRFRTAQSLSQHIASNPHPVYSCSQCSRTFGNERALQQHVSDSPSHACHYCLECDRSFQSAQALAQHRSDSLAHQHVEEENEDALLSQLWEIQRIFQEHPHEPERAFLESIEMVQNPTPISRYLVGFEPTGFPLGWDNNDMDSSSDGATEILGDLSYDNEEARRLVPRSIIGTPPLLPSVSHPTGTDDLSRGAGASDGQTPSPNLDSDPLALTGPVQTPRPQNALLDAFRIIDVEHHDVGPLTLEAQLIAERNKNKALEQELRELREALKLEKLIRQCGMCYEKTTDAVTKCGHLFCSGCVVSWQKQHPLPFSAPCPMCRSPMGKARRVFRE